MDGFSYRRGQLYCETIPVASLARRHGTPLYVYSRKAMVARLGELRAAFETVRPLVCFSIKANANLSILRLLGRAGAGFDIVSGGELFRALRAGARPDRIVFAGVGKTRHEIRDAIQAGILMFNAESEQELAAINETAKELRRTTTVGLRLNPDVDARTHAKTTTGKKESKFGIDLDRALRIFAGRDRFANLRIRGIHLHIGSPIYSVQPYRDALRKAEAFVREARAMGAMLEYLNVGGGFCISYDGRKVSGPADYARVILPVVKRLGLKLILEPGRYVVGNSAILVSTVTYVKTGWLDREFVVLDAGMNDLVRPALYGSYHQIWPVRGRRPPMLGGRHGRKGLKTVDIVGPICETSDCFAKDRRIPPVAEGDLVALFSAGAYGMAMSSNYNARPRAAEVLVTGARCRVIRKRETYEELIRGE